MIDKKTFGSFIKSKRLEKNYSQKELAELLYVTEWAISKWERGLSYPDITMISDICRALDISEHELVTASVDTEARRMKHEAYKFRVISGTWFWIPTITYAVTLVICFICNLAVNGTLSWFFIVFASLLCAYSFIPTFTSFFGRNKLLVFVVSSLASVSLLLVVCAIYTGSAYWVPTVCTGIMIGYSIVFIPIILAKTEMKKYRFVIAFAAAFILTVLLLLIVSLWKHFMLLQGVMITCYWFIPAIICTYICTLKTDPFIKAGICTSIAAIIAYCSNYVIGNLTKGTTENYYQVDFGNWEQYANGNINLLIFGGLLLIGVTFIGIGCFRKGN
jgi:transcriptional regulator with XRE-family HTH domain